MGTVARTTLYHLLSNPKTLQKLYEELRAANVTLPYPQYSEVRDLPYLDACVLEGSRMHPPFALPFERVVPEGGIELFGYWLPPGTNIGGNPYVVNRDKAMFGEDAEHWRPERWIEHGEEHKKKLERSNLTVSNCSTAATTACRNAGFRFEQTLMGGETVRCRPPHLPRQAHWHPRDQEVHLVPRPELRGEFPSKMHRAIFWNLDINHP